MDLQKIASAFTQELVDASSGKDTSLRFLRTNISSIQIPDNEIFQVLVVGGSVFISAKVRKINGKLTVMTEKTFPISEFKDIEIFLSFINKYIIKSIKYVSLNFAFPQESVLRNGIIDGKLLSATKMHIFKGLIGKNVGEELEKYVKVKTGQNIQVAVANDTVCLLLAGLSVSNKDSLGCLIVGTGYNAAFFLDEVTAVNLEAAGFDKFETSESGLWVNSQSQNMNRSKFEKEVSGAYLYKHFNFLIRQRGMKTQEISSTKELSDVAAEKSEAGKLAQELLDYSAQLVATHIIGIAEFKKRDMIFVAEGSLFWKGNLYKEMVEKTIKKLTKYKIEFMKIEDSSIIGAAKLFDMN